MRIPAAEERAAVVGRSIGLALGTSVAPPNPRSTAATSSTAAATTGGTTTSGATSAGTTSLGASRGVGAAGAANTSGVANDAAKESSPAGTGAASKITSSVAGLVLGSLVLAVTLF